MIFWEDYPKGEENVDSLGLSLHQMVDKFAWRGDIGMWASGRRRRKRRSHGQTEGSTGSECPEAETCRLGLA